MRLFFAFSIFIFISSIFTLQPKAEGNNNDPMMLFIVKQLAGVDAKQVEIQKQVADLQTIPKQVAELQTNVKTLFGYHQNSLECLSGWKSYSKHCYYFAYESITWPEAKAACEKRNVYLVKIDNNTENDWIKARMSERPFDFMWIGLNDIESEGKWIWVSDSTEATFTDWLSGEPNGQRVENCGHLWGANSYKWNDVPCNGRNYGYICEQNANIRSN